MGSLSTGTFYSNEKVRNTCQDETSSEVLNEKWFTLSEKSLEDLFLSKKLILYLSCWLRVLTHMYLEKIYLVGQLIGEQLLKCYLFTRARKGL